MPISYYCTGNIFVFDWLCTHLVLDVGILTASFGLYLSVEGKNNNKVSTFHVQQQTGEVWWCSMVGGFGDGTLTSNIDVESFRDFWACVNASCTWSTVSLLYVYKCEENITSREPFMCVERYQEIFNRWPQLNDGHDLDLLSFNNFNNTAHNIASCHTQKLNPR